MALADDFRIYRRAHDAIAYQFTKGMISLDGFITAGRFSVWWWLIDRRSQFIKVMAHEKKVDKRLELPFV